MTVYRLFLLSLIMLSIATLAAITGCATVPPENVIEFKENKICVYKPCRVV